MPAPGLTTTEGSNALNLSIGSGVLRFDRLDNSGNRTGFVDLGQVEEFKTQPDMDFKEQYSSMTAARRLLRRVSTKTGGTVSITGKEFNPYNAALVQMGAVSELTQSTATVTDAALTSAVKLGRYFPTGKRNITVSSVKQGATTLVAGTDYTVDTVRGIIYFKPGGAATENSAATWSGSAAAITSGSGLNQVSIATVNKIEGYLHFIPDPTAGPVIEVVDMKISLEPQGEFGLITDDYGNWQLSAKILDDSANNAAFPYGRLVYGGNV